jgi:hypothetical protein
MAITISGPIIDALNASGFMVSKVWGASGNIISSKRRRRWNDAIKRFGQADGPRSRNIIVRCVPENNDVSWLPFPDAAPRWVVDKSGAEDDWSQFVANSQEASRRVSRLLAQFPISEEISVSAEVTLGGGRPYIDLYFSIPITSAEEFKCASTWKNQNKLFELVSQKYPCVLAEYSPQWLSPLRIDIFIPELNVAIEYNGEQHYRAVDFFGGIESFKSTQKRDQLKSDLCFRHGVKLILWPYWKSVQESHLKIELEKVAG